MVSCSSFASDIDCVLQVQNDYNIKLIVLMFMFGYILFSLWYSREQSFSDSAADMLKFVSFNLFPKVLLVFFPLFLLTLKNDVSVELIINTLVIFYLIILGLAVGLALFLGKDYIYSLMGDRRDFKSKFKYIKN